MCCNPTKSGKNKVMKIFGDKDTAIFWKAIDVFRSKNQAGRKYYRFEGTCTTFTFHPGINCASLRSGDYNGKGRKVPKNYDYDPSEPRGIHVYFTEKMAIGKNPYWKVVFPVICRKEDFICADRGQAVFCKIEILEKDWKKRIPIVKTRIETTIGNPLTEK